MAIPREKHAEVVRQFVETSAAATEAEVMRTAMEHIMMTAADLLVAGKR
jgi:hypothetical protein